MTTKFKKGQRAIRKSTGKIVTIVGPSVTYSDHYICDYGKHTVDIPELGLAPIDYSVYVIPAGNRVRVRTVEAMCNEFGAGEEYTVHGPHDIFSEDMEKYCGKEVVLEKNISLKSRTVGGLGYRCWYNWMFDDLGPEEEYEKEPEREKKEDDVYIKLPEGFRNFLLDEGVLNAYKEHMKHRENLDTFFTRCKDVDYVYCAFNWEDSKINWSSINKKWRRICEYVTDKKFKKFLNDRGLYYLYVKLCMDNNLLENDPWEFANREKDNEFYVSVPFAWPDGEEFLWQEVEDDWKKVIGNRELIFNGFKKGDRVRYDKGAWNNTYIVKSIQKRSDGKLVACLKKERDGKEYLDSSMERIHKLPEFSIGDLVDTQYGEDQILQIDYKRNQIILKKNRGTGFDAVKKVVKKADPTNLKVRITQELGKIVQEDLQVEEVEEIVEKTEALKSNRYYDPYNKQIISTYGKVSLPKDFIKLTEFAPGDIVEVGDGRLTVEVGAIFHPELSFVTAKTPTCVYRFSQVKRIVKKQDKDTLYNPEKMLEVLKEDVTVFTKGRGSFSPEPILKASKEANFRKEEEMKSENEKIDQVLELLVAKEQNEGNGMRKAANLFLTFLAYVGLIAAVWAGAWSWFEASPEWVRFGGLGSSILLGLLSINWTVNARARRKVLNNPSDD